jgi:hypothetical protein
VEGSTDYVPPTPIGLLSGMAPAFTDEFTAMPAISSTDTTAKYFPAQTQPVGGSQFGDAVFMDPGNLGGAPNPYTQLGSYLRIRCQYYPSVTDPQGWGRKWITGLLSTAFPGGTAGFFAKLPYYAECRFLAPVGGVPWPAFWQLTKNALVNNVSNIETDTTEDVGLFPMDDRSGGILYPGGGAASVNLGAAATDAGAQPYAFPNDTGGWEFHTYGVQVTDTTTTFYIDNVAIGNFPTPALPAGLTGPREDFFMMDNAFGGGGWGAWESPLPNSAWYDMWIDRMVVYQ